MSNATNNTKGRMTTQEAEALVKQHGSQRAAAKAAGCTRKAIQYALRKGADKQDKAAGSASAELRGFQVGESTRVLAHKPVTTIKSRFYNLKRGLAYPIADVAREWVHSEDTIRAHAKDAGCFRFVEVKNEQFVPCVMHPDTAKQYPVE